MNESNTKDLLLIIESNKCLYVWRQAFQLLAAGSMLSLIMMISVSGPLATGKNICINDNNSILEGDEALHIVLLQVGEYDKECLT